MIAATSLRSIVVRTRQQEEKDDQRQNFHSARSSDDANDDDANDVEEEDPEENASANDDGASSTATRPVKLYKSSRLKGYLTLALASGIYFNAANKSSDVVSRTAVPSTKSQRQYAMSVGIVSIIVSTVVLAMHLDPSPLKRIWQQIFKTPSKIELLIILFLVLWWSVAVGVETTVAGIAGDGKQQYSLYFSAWACCLTSYGMLERWWVDYGWSSFKAFISSWPYRAPAWICILFVSALTLIWYLDLWKNYSKLDRETEQFVYTMLNDVPEGHWQWLVSLTVFTLAPAIGFVLMELFRDIDEHGRNEEKSKVENIAEGIILGALVAAWIPSVGIATTPGGPASLVGNAYFATYSVILFTFEALVWWVHDYRLEVHQGLRDKAAEYKQRQAEILAQTKEIQAQCAKQAEEKPSTPESTKSSRRSKKPPPENKPSEEIEVVAMSTEFFDADSVE